MSTDPSNKIFDLAVALINQSNRNIFLTGKAGTGKTTFLKHIRQHCPKQMAILAPTGVAAINAGGVTIHSFLQLPFGVCLPVPSPNEQTDAVDRHTLLSRLRFTADKRKMLQQLELLIIDEISMVRADTLDAVDAILRHARHKHHERFGGVQMLFIGDMFQLPPVTRDQDWNILSEYYNSPYFFDSQVIREEAPLYIEFDKVYRQSDPLFIDLLNQVRNNDLNENGLAILESRFHPDFHAKEQDEYILLTTHNEIARNINGRELNRLSGKSSIYSAIVEGDFPESAYPADKELELKIGAQVMFIRNDLAEKGKRFFNGKIGVVKKLEKDKITIYCKDEEKDIEVTAEGWDNIRYTLNKSSQTMEENLLGSFKQFPIRLAWAITIHKSQGLTFDKAIIDAGEAFAPGQVYVALSRCTNLQGMILRSRLKKNSFFSDPRIIQFSQSIASSDALEEELRRSKRQYQLKLLMGYFDLGNALILLSELHQQVSTHKNSFREGALAWLEDLQQKVLALQETSIKFHNWLKLEFNNELSPDENQVLSERIKKGAAHFIPEIAAWSNTLHQSPASTDNRELAKEYNDSLKALFSELEEKRYMLHGMDGHLDPEVWMSRRKAWTMPAFFVNAYAGASQKKTDSPHPELHRRLRKCRETICDSRGLAVYLVAGTTTIDEMARYLPQNLDELQMISGFGETKAKAYGKLFLDVINEYCEEQGLSSLIHEKPEGKTKKKKSKPVKEKKLPSHDQTLEFFLQGNSLKDIAVLRGLSYSTIESHFARLIGEKRMDVLDIMPKDHFDNIMAAIEEKKEISGLNALRSALDDKYSFGELRMVMSSIKPFNESE